MYTKKEIASLNSALKKVEKCNGDCKHCSKCHIYTSKSGLYYAFGCDALPKTMFDSISDTMKNLKSEALETLRFELNIA